MESAGHILLALLGLLLAAGLAGGCPATEKEDTARQPAAEQPAPAEVAAEPVEPDQQAAVAPQEEQTPPAPPEWSRPRFDEYAEERADMVEGQIADRGVRDADVLDAMRHVPRHLFIPRARRHAAHADGPLPIGQGQTISQPYIVGLMTELLELEPGEKVLEIGTGSGYQAAVLSEMTPHVYTIEILGALHESASARLKDLGYATIEQRQDDGYYGWTEAAPFDAIIVTAAAGHVPPPLVAQLKPGGRMAIPVGPVYGAQQLLLISKDDEGRLRTQSVLPVRFVPMTGHAMEQ